MNENNEKEQLKTCEIVTYICDGIMFHLPRRYRVKRIIGRGGYGTVASAFDTVENRKVAIKKVTNVFVQSREFQKRILREMLILNHFSFCESCNTIVQLYDLVLPSRSYEEFKDVYIIMEYMDSDLRTLLNSRQVISDMSVKYFLYNILKALKVIHSAGVLHRDIKPSNILLNQEMDLKICDMGLARGFDSDRDPHMSTTYVSTRWYRAPELLFVYEKSGVGIDIYSAGCILAEMLGDPSLPTKKRVLFPGDNYLDQVNLILSVLGTPQEEDIKGCDKAKKYVASLPIREKVNLYEKYPNAHPDAVDLLEKMIHINPEKRISIDDALQHPYLKRISDEDEFELPSRFFDFRMTKEMEEVPVKKMIYDFIVLFNRKRNHFHSQVRFCADIRIDVNEEKDKKKKKKKKKHKHKHHHHHNNNNNNNKQKEENEKEMKKEGKNIK